jgi:hypothetical protein
MQLSGGWQTDLADPAKVSGRFELPRRGSFFVSTSSLPRWA